MKKVFLLILLMGATLFVSAQNYDSMTFNELKERANNGDVKAMMSLGWRYGNRKMDSEKLNWYRKAATCMKQKEDIYGLITLASFYEQGKVFKKNTQEANRLYKKAINKCNLLISQGNTEGYMRLAYMFRYGSGVQKDEKKAFNLYLEAANRGDAEGAYNVGMFYKFGLGVEKDEYVAFKWLLKAAENGNSDAMSEVGECYDDGKGISKNGKEAEKWFLKSASQGNAHVSFKLGLFYQYRQDNKEEAIYWFKKDADINYEQTGKEDCVSLKCLRELGVYYHPSAKYSSETSSSSSSRTSSSSSTTSSSSNKGLLYSGTYTQSPQGYCQETGQYTESMGPGFVLSVEIYDSYITINGSRCEHTSTSGSWKTFKGNEMYGVTQYYKVNYNNFEMSSYMISLNPYTGGYNTFVYQMKKGEASFDIHHNNTTTNNGGYSIGGNRGGGINKGGTTTYKKDCYMCHGSGKCRTCNGRHRYLNRLTNKYITCPNCGPDGRCRTCNGTGKK